MAEWEQKAEYSKSEYQKADELLTDKKKEVEQAQGELSRVAENTDLFEKVVDLSYGNEQLQSKIQVLQDRLEKAYEFMKRFVINGRNMLADQCSFLTNISN